MKNTNPKIKNRIIRFLSKEVDLYVKLKMKLLPSIQSFLFYLSVITFCMALYDIGFLQYAEEQHWMHSFYHISLMIYFVLLSVRIPIIIKNVKVNFIIFKLIIFLFLLFYIINFNFLQNIYGDDFPIFGKLANIYFTYFLIAFIFTIELSKNSLRVFKLKVNPPLLFVGSFFFFILIGAGLLMLPNSTVKGIRFVDALFTSTSAVCVTGLSVIDTGTNFTFLGKSILVMLIQVGGLGVMTFTSFIAYFFYDSSSFQNNVYLKDFVNSEQLSEVFKVIIKIILYTFTIEAIGAFFIFINLDDLHFGTTNDQIKFSVFHAISAFCNAGFSTLPNNLYQGFIKFNYNIQLTIAFLIILGGIGFPVMLNIHNYIKKNVYNRILNMLNLRPFEYSHRNFNINTKIGVATTIYLLIFGTIVFFVLEYNNTLTEHSTYGKIIVSFFNSVTPRTAGFNNIDMAQLLHPTIIIIMFLMWVGASPSSTGGGIKTTTFALSILTFFSLARGRDRVEVYKRKIANTSLRQAFAVVFLSILVIGFIGFLITFFEKDKSLLQIYFETVSAYGTVGLSLGITPFLHDASKYLLSLAMFLGRVGTLTFFMALLFRNRTLNYWYPKESVFVG